MLRIALNVNYYRERVSNAELYGDIPRVSLKVRRLRHAGHAISHPELRLSKVILWKPVHGYRGKGHPRSTFVGTGVETTGKLETLMLNKMLWRRNILDPRAAPTDPP